MTWQEMKELEGRRVVATINYDPLITHEGILIHLDVDGEAAIRNDDGRIGYSWPVLDMQLAP